MNLEAVEETNRREREALAESIELSMMTTRTTDYVKPRKAVAFVAPVLDVAAENVAIVPVRSVRLRRMVTPKAHARMAPFVPILRPAPVSAPFERRPIDSIESARARAAEAI